MFILNQNIIKSRIMDVKKLLLIYVVEDNRIYNKLVCEFLAKKNYTNVKSFESGKECINAVANGERPNIVIQDYFLEDSTGIEVLQNVKKHSKNSEFIFLTANESLDVAVNSIKYGAYDYIIKDNDVAFQKVVDKIQKITKIFVLNRTNKMIRQMMIITILVLLLIIITGLLLYSFNIIEVF